MAPHIVWLWACLAHRLLGGVHVSRSEWTERWRMGPLGTAPHGGINVYCCSAPSEGRQWGITSALWPNMAAISMSCLSAVWLVFLRPGPSVLLWVSVILCLICLSGRLSICPCLPYSRFFVANFLALPPTQCRIILIPSFLLSFLLCHLFDRRHFFFALIWKTA